ncbi:MAG: hypothetical protein ACM3ZF_02770 [Mycobacterium leprae]
MWWWIVAVVVLLALGNTLAIHPWLLLIIVPALIIYALVTSTWGSR